ncbi:glycosyltransferase family 39 protein [bacterium]|nr:glycosyltransferase family 39 protein [bacterium]
MKKKFWIIFGLSVFVRLLVIAIVGLGDDEVYHWVWAQHLDLSFYDHPPMVTYIIWFLTKLLGDSAFVVHLEALIAVSLFTWILYLWAKEIYPEKEAISGMILIVLVPIFFVGGVIVAPDSPLSVFWVLTLYLIYLALKENRNSYWYIAGISAGFACLSKYNGFLLPFLVVLYLIFSPQHRFWLRKKEPYLAFFLMFIIFSPVIIWNAQNDWASFYFQFMGRHGGGFSIKRFFVFVGSQLTYFSPFAIILAGGGFWRLYKEGFSENGQWEKKYLFFTSFPIIILFSLNSFFSSSFKPHWPALGYIGGFLAAGSLPFMTSGWKKIYKINLCLCGLMIFVLIGQTLYPILPIPAKEDITNDLYGWGQLGKEIKNIRKEITGEVFLLAERYQTGAQFSFAAREEVYIMHPTRISAENFWQETEKIIGKDVIYFTHSRYFTLPEKNYHFDSIKWVKEIPVLRAGKIVRNFYLYYLVNFQGVRER